MKTVSTGVKESGVRTFSKKDLIDLVAIRTGLKRSDVKIAIIEFVDVMREELGAGNRLEFRNFGVFEIKRRRRRRAQNPKTLQAVVVPPRRTVKFKVGADLKARLAALDHAEERGLLPGKSNLNAPEVRVVATSPPRSSERRSPRTSHPAASPQVEDDSRTGHAG